MKQQIFKTGFTLLCCILSMLLISIPVIAAWKNSITIQNKGTHNYKAIKLTPEIYNNSNYDLSDILIVDESSKKELPYFINSYNTNTMESDYIKPLKKFDAFTKDGNTYEDFYVENFDDFYINGEKQTEILTTSLKIETNTVNFAKNIEVLGSYDGQKWVFIKDDNIYNVDGNKKLDVDFNDPLNYTYYRIKILDNEENISFSNVSLKFSQRFINEEAFKESFNPEFRVKEDSDTTIIEVLGLKNIKVSELKLYTNSQFSRYITFANGNAQNIYHLPFDDVIYENTTLNFNGYSESNDVTQLKINNGDDIPIKIDKISVEYFTDEIIFKGDQASSFVMNFGDPMITTPPVYDIVNYKGLVFKEGYDILELGEISPTPNTVEPKIEKPDYTLAFNSVVVVVSILLGFIIILKVRNSRDL